MKVQTDILVRTLITAGFTVTNARRQPKHIEIECVRTDAFGIPIPYLFVLNDQETFSENIITSVHEAANTQGRAVVYIARTGGKDWLGWEEALEVMGGAVPTWRALGNDYVNWLTTTSLNQLPEGALGEAWQLFEFAVADGLEFLFGHRVRRLGGIRRGQRVSDMIAQTSDDTLLVIDAKSSKEPFGVTMAELRPLIEYVQTQKQRQKGNVDVRAATIVAKEFKQSPEELSEVSQEFFVATGVLLGCLTTDTLLEMISELSRVPKIRNAILWRRVFCRAGLLKIKFLKEEIQAAINQRVEKSPIDSQGAS